MVTAIPRALLLFLPGITGHKPPPVMCLIRELWHPLEPCEEDVLLLLRLHYNHCCCSLSKGHWGTTHGLKMAKHLAGVVRMSPFNRGVHVVGGSGCEIQLTERLNWGFMCCRLTIKKVGVFKWGSFPRTLQLRVQAYILDASSRNSRAALDLYLLSQASNMRRSQKIGYLS